MCGNISSSEDPDKQLAVVKTYNTVTLVWNPKTKTGIWMHGSGNLLICDDPRISEMVLRLSCDPGRNASKFETASPELSKKFWEMVAVQEQIRQLEEQSACLKDDLLALYRVARSRSAT